MSIKKIYIIRHGQTEFNAKGIVQGRGVDTSLNGIGKSQADAFYTDYRQMNFDRIYISTLKRSFETVKRFIDNGTPYTSLEGLDEISWGVNEGKDVTLETKSNHERVLKAWNTGDTRVALEGGESPQDVAKRQREAIREILSNEEEQTILICHHGRAMRILLCQLLNYPLKYMDMFAHSNLCLYILNYTGNMFTVDTFADTQHLNKLLKNENT